MGLGIGQRIKKRRLELNLTQEDLAKRMGYKSKAAVCKVEGGEDNITSDRIEKFARALSCTPAYIMGWEDEDADVPVEFERYYRDNKGLKSRLATFLDAFAKLPAETQDEIIDFTTFKASKGGKNDES